MKGVKGPTTGQVLPLQVEMCPNVSAQERRDGQHAAALAQAVSCETQAPSALTGYRSPTPPSSAAFASPAPTSISLRLLSLPVRAPRQHRQYDSAKWLCIAGGSRDGHRRSGDMPTALPGSSGSSGSSGPELSPVAGNIPALTTVLTRWFCTVFIPSPARQLYRCQEAKRKGFLGYCIPPALLPSSNTTVP